MLFLADTQTCADSVQPLCCSNIRIKKMNSKK